MERAGPEEVIRDIERSILGRTEEKVRREPNRTANHTWRQMKPDVLGFLM